MSPVGTADNSPEIHFRERRYYGFYNFISIIFIVLIHYLTEVYLGSSLCVYDSEIGISGQCCEITKISQHEFWGKEMPFLLTSLALPLLAYSAMTSISLLIAAFYLLFHSEAKT
ncbi:MAG: hypothetical protein HC887_09255 [Desulfobacteraceae bacterium]|nr:hypothetical protein [Desulfobacteraceae bacterium]